MFRLPFLYIYNISNHHYTLIRSDYCKLDDYMSSELPKTEQNRSEHQINIYQEVNDRWTLYSAC